MRNILRSEKLKSIFPYFLFAIALLIAYKAIIEISFLFDLVKQAWKIITPFFYGLILAYILNIPCDGIQKLLLKSKIAFVKKRKKMLSILLVYILLALIIYLVLILIIPVVSSSITIFSANFSSYYASALQAVDYINSLELPIFNIDADEIMNLLQDFIQSFNAESLASSVNALLGVSSAVFNGILAFITSIYILIEKIKIRDYFTRLLKAFSPAEVYNVTMEYSSRLNQNIKRYIQVQTIDGCILGTIVTIELAIMGSPLFLILGIMLAILNYIPYFGSIFGTIIAILVVALTQGFTTAIIAAIILIITQQLDGNVIQPRLMGGSFSLSPLLVIISITLGGAAAGVFGMIVAIPIVAVLKDILDGIIVHYERKKADGTDWQEPLSAEPPDDPNPGLPAVAETESEPETNNAPIPE